MSCQLYDMQICYKLQICCHNVLFNTHTTQSLCFLCNKINKSGMPFSQNHLKNFDLYHYLYHSHDDGIFFPFCFFMGKSIELLQLCFDLHVFVPFLSNFAWNACFDKFEWRFEWRPKVTYGLWTPWLQFERSRFLGPGRPLIAHDSSLLFD